MAAGPVITPVSGLVAYAAIGNELVFMPSANLLPSTTYTATISTGVQDLAGQPLAIPYTWIFKTGTAVIPAPAGGGIEVPAR